ncbi:hypothetical protein Q673_02800 [Marinobacter sp. EN3]|jgi:hypothetical protein|uniref:hypothetical protein n=1 Tax=Marinobacter sp. EN3 TaxID=1397533 RepID=UPI0003B7FC04|nr:hypothetical protein [Marinobacter sp. EN3]ERS12018.1 hypothetical protein Q673_02800 [Marinobacter sp. EN3]
MDAPAPNHRDTDVVRFLEDLDGGVFLQKIARAISEVAGGVVDHDAKGNLDLKLNFQRIGNSYQVNIAHTLKYTVPTMRGKISEEDTTETPMHVNTGGKVSIFPENQNQLFTRKGEPQTPQNTEE